MYLTGSEQGGWQPTVLSLRYQQENKSLKISIFFYWSWIIDLYPYLSTHNSPAKLLKYTAIIIDKRPKFLE